jgi:hypothetical protein
LPCSFGLSATRQQYFSLRTNQPPATSQQYSSLRTNQHQLSATSQPNRLDVLLLSPISLSYMVLVESLTTPVAGALTLRRRSPPRQRPAAQALPLLSELMRAPLLLLCCVGVWMLVWRSREVAACACIYSRPDGDGRPASGRASYLCES